MFAVAAASGSLLLGACGGEEIDPCEEDFIHGCEGATSFTLASEAGEIRHELIRIDDVGGAVMATHAYFFQNQNPATRGFGVPFEDTGCVDYRDRMQFSPGAGDVQQQVANSRDYLDAGDTVTLTSSNGLVVEMAKATNTADRSSILVHDIVYLPNDDAGLFENNVSWDIDIAGSEELPGLDLISPESAAQPDPNNIIVLDEPQVISPPAWTPTFVTETEYFGGVNIPEGEDLTVTWDTAEALFTDDVTVLAFVGFLGTQGIDFLCVAPDNGEIVVPAAVLNEVDASGSIIHGLLTHVAAESRFLDNARYDMLAADCRFSTYTVEPQ
jgi:hypothetical protein